MARFKILFMTDFYPTKKNPVDGIFVKEHAKAASLYNDVAVIHNLVQPVEQMVCTTSKTKR